MNWLKKAVVDAHSPQFTILQVMDKNIGGHRTPRSREVVHASDATKPGFCPKQWALMEKLQVKQKDEYISTALAATFDVGLMTESLVVNKWLGQHAVGDWQCHQCAAMKFMTTKPGEGCPSQGMCDWQYKQKNFISEEFGVSGGIDVLVNLGSPKLIITEVKIMKVEDYEVLKAPLPEHRIRTAMYLKIISDSPSPVKEQINMNEGRMLYVSRGYGKKNPDSGQILPFKEFKVDRDDDTVLPYLKRAKQVKIFRETGKMPCGICATALDVKAKHCPVAGPCFNGDHPTQQEKV